MKKFIDNYEIKSIDNIVCLPGTGILRLFMIANRSIKDLLPYINDYVPKSRFLPKINWIRFPFKGYPEKKGNWNVAIKDKEIIVAKFNSNDEAKEIAKEVIEFLNHIYEIKDTLSPRFDGWSPPKVMDILKYLPKTNCKKCGCFSCMAFAKKLAEGEAELDQCPVLQNEPENIIQLNKMSTK